MKTIEQIMPNPFDEFYEETVMEQSNEELSDLVRLHMGRVRLNDMHDWLKQAFEAGRKSKN